MAFVDPNTLAAIFGGQPGGDFDPRAARQQALWQALGTAGGQMAQAASQPGATFAGSLGAGTQGFFQGQANAQQMQAQQLQMQRARQKMEAEQARQKLFRDLLFDEKDFMDAVDTGGVRPSSPTGGPSITSTRGGAVATPAPEPVGLIARQFESSDSGVDTVSSGHGDAGGVSYGEFQLASKTGTMGDFLRSPEGQPFAAQFGDLKPGTDQFNQVYREVARGAREPFAAAQRQFIERTHVQPVVEAARQAGLDTSSRAVQEALFSQAVQHSGEGNLKIINDAAARVGPNATPNQVIDALYQARGDYASRFASPAATTDRYKREREQVLGLLGQEAPGQAPAGPATPQAAPAAPQQGGGFMASLPDETKRLLALMDPQDAAKAVINMQPGAPDLPAEVDALRWLTQGDDAAARQLYAGQLQREAQGEPDQRARKISDYQQLYGVSRADAVRMADQLVDWEVNPNTGRIVTHDTRTGDIREIVPSRDGADGEPEMRGPTLWDVAERGNPTGLGSGVAEVANRVGGQMGLGDVGADTVAQRRYFQQATQDLIRALSINERFPVAEMERIRKEVDIGPSVFADESTLKASMRSLDTTLQDRIDYYRFVADDPSQPEDLRQAMGQAATQMRWFRKRLGVPKGDQDNQGGQSGDVPEGVTQLEWDNMTAEDRALWQN